GSQAEHRRALRAAARPGRAVGRARLRQAQDRHLEGAGGRGDARAAGDGSVNGISAKWRDRLLYMVSPIVFLLVWQLLLMAGFGDRRFIPAPRDIALRFLRLTGDGGLPLPT